MKIIVLLLVLGTVLLSGCAGNEQPSPEENVTPEESVTPGENVTVVETETPEENVTVVETGNARRKCNFGRKRIRGSARDLNFRYGENFLYCKT